VQVAGRLRPAAAQFVPRLSRRLAEADHSGQRPHMNTAALVSGLAELGDPAAVPTLIDTINASVRHEQWHTAASALNALASFGTRAAPALYLIRPLADAENVDLSAAATAALWELGRDAADTVPRLESLLDSYRRHEAADVLGRIGPPAKAVLPRLRTMLNAGYEWTRVHAAAALWDVGGEAEADAVVSILLTAWEVNDATSNHVLACLNRMGPAAAPALPRIQAEVALPRRSGRFKSITDDEELQRTCRSVLTRLR
jgi:HEAT repeat protein